jgi:hypothetical protein
MSSKNTMIKRCSFATGAAVQQAFFERCQRGVSETRVFEMTTVLNSRVNPTTSYAPTLAVTQRTSLPYGIP